MNINIYSSELHKLWYSYVQIEFVRVKVWMGNLEI